MDAVSIPLPVIISGISGIFVAGVSIGAYMQRYRTRSQCDIIHQRAAAELIKLETETENSIERIHERIDEVLERVTSVHLMLSHLEGRTHRE